MERLTSAQTIIESDGKTHEQIYCFGHLWGPAFLKKGTKDYEEYLTIVKRLAEYEDLEEQGKMSCEVGDKVIKKLEEIKNPMYREDGSLMAQKAFIRIDEAIEIVKQFTS